MPDWANGALLLVPCTEEGLAESGLELKPHHVIALASDVELIDEALAEFPRRRRPQCKLDLQCGVRSGVCSSVCIGDAFCS